MMLGQKRSLIANAIPNHKIDFFGPTSLLFSSFPYYVLILVMVVGISLYQVTRNPYLLLFIIYAVIPLIDQMISMDTKNPTNDQAKKMAQEFKYQVPLFLTIIIDWMVFFYALNVYSQFNFSIPNLFRMLGFVIAISNLNAAQFSISHQIMHKPGWRRILGTLHMLKTLNIHFTYQHLFGHHRKVATPEDPASAKMDQNVYIFFIKSYLGAYKSVYNMQKQKNKKIYENMAILSILASLLFTFAIYYRYGSTTLFFFLIQVLGAVFYLQVINYIEHYGLRRKKLSNGDYEKVTIKHSWNAPHRLSNYLFFKLQRHSDHHQNAMKPYQVLLTMQQSPQLPHGYIVMTVMALFPPIYKRIMNPLVQGYNIFQTKQQKVIIYENAVKQTRDFIIDLSIYVTCLFVGFHLVFN